MPRPVLWNDQVEQLAANGLSVPLDAIASLLQRLVRHALIQRHPQALTRRVSSFPLGFLLELDATRSAGPGCVLRRS